VRRERSVVVRLLLLALGIVTPWLVLIGVLGKLYGDAQRHVIEAERVDVTRNAVEIIDCKVTETITLLRALATSPHLQDGNLPSFHSHAVEAAKLIDETIVLLDPSGQQLVSTSTPFGAELPRRSDMRPIAGVFAGSTVEVSDIVTGTLAQASIILISVPVRRDGAVAYALSSSLSPAALSGVLAEAGMKPEWIAAIVDRQGVFVARSRNAEAFIGQPARPELIAAATGPAREGTFSNVTYDAIHAINSFIRTRLTGWTVVVGVPEEMLSAPLHRTLWRLFGLGVALALVSAMLALWASHQIARPARALADAALSFVHVGHRPWIHDRISEFNYVGRALDQAAEVMRERDQARAGLQRTNALMETILASTPDLIYAKDRDSRLILSNAATQAAIGRSWDELRGRNEAEWHRDPREAAALLANDRRVIESGETIQVEEVFTSSAGPRTYLTTKAPLRDATGTVVGLVGVSTDITERKAREEHVQFIMRELSHRSKNLLAVVQAIAQQTGRRSRSTGEFVKAFEGRLGALASLHDLLIRQEWSGAPIHDLVAAQLLPFPSDPTHLDVAGPLLLLTPQAAQAISLALHELATNASKYGAWSNPAGKVTVRWTIENAGDQPRFVMTWEESGGPPVTSPQRQGFGSIVLERMTAHAFQDSAITLDFPPEGVRWRMDVAADAALASGRRLAK